jgi:hypothetical protein
MKPVLEIVNAEYLHDYVIRIEFNTNEVLDVDLLPMILHDRNGVFSPLLDAFFFQNFHVNYTLCWGDEIDVAPEYLFFLAHKNDEAYQSLFKEWGYVS